MRTLNLPEPIAAYFAADRLPPEALGACFTPQATVRDEDRTHVGRAAIAAWRADASARYVYTVEPLAHEVRDGVHVVRGQVAGNFPGSPVALSYHFRLERGLIASLEITA